MNKELYKRVKGANRPPMPHPTIVQSNEKHENVKPLPDNYDEICDVCLKELGVKTIVRNYGVKTICKMCAGYIDDNIANSHNWDELTMVINMLMEEESRI